MNTGLVATSHTHSAIYLTILASSPQALPIPYSPIPWGQDKFNSYTSKGASLVNKVNSYQSALLLAHI